jgi:hypothetical protein
MANITPPEEIVAMMNQMDALFIEEFLIRVMHRTPVITGTLQAGWEGKVVSDGYEISNNVEYASYVEYGTEKMAPRAMLQTTLAETESILEEAAKKAGLKK